MQQIDPALLQRLDALAAKLNVTAQYLWGILVKQAVISAWVAVVVCALCLLYYFLFFGSWVWMHTHREEAVRWNGYPYEREPVDFKETPGKFEWLYEENVASYLYMILGGTGALVSGITFFCQLPDAITGLFNPQYLALQQLFALLKLQGHPLQEGQAYEVMRSIQLYRPQISPKC